MNHTDDLYNHAKAEYEGFIKELTSKSPCEIIDSAYEITIKREFLSIIENDDLQPDLVGRLSRYPNPLVCLYDEWLSNDYSFQDVLHDTMRNWTERETEFTDDNSFDYSVEDSGGDLEP